MPADLATFYWIAYSPQDLPLNIPRERRQAGRRTTTHMEHCNKFYVSIIWAAVSSCFVSTSDQYCSNKTHILVDMDVN